LILFVLSHRLSSRFKCDLDLEFEQKLMCATRIPTKAKSSCRKRLDPRKQPTQSRATDTVNAVLEAAARILEHHGFEGYTTNAIAEQAGVSIGSLYQYFPDKEAVTVALIERECALLLADVAEADSITNYRGAINHLVNAAIAHQLRRPRLARLLDVEENRLPIGPRVRQVREAIRGKLLRILSRPDSPCNKGTQEAAFDLIAIAKGIADAAGERRETDAHQLERRVRRAAYGYIGLR
jgi:AcrR family transcriptional regulator